MASTIKRAALKKFEELVVVVPFFGAHLVHLKRHIEWINDLGYDAFFVHLQKPEFSSKFQFISSRGKFGMREVWTEQIEQALNKFPQKKILFTFSNPTACAIQALARRGSRDVSALICDSGPSTSLWTSLMSHYKENEPIDFFPTRVLAATVTSRLWAATRINDIQDSVAQLPPKFPILSIRGWKDRIVTPADIDRNFEDHQQIDWRKASLPDAGHLNGLRDFEDEYNAAVIPFLREFSTPLHGDSKTVARG